MECDANHILIVRGRSWLCFSCWHECIIEVHHCTHSCTVAWGQTKHSSSHSTGMRRGSCMVSDCIHHRAGGTEFGHALDLTFSKIGMIIMMNVTVTIHTIIGHFFKVEVSCSNPVRLGLCPAARPVLPKFSMKTDPDKCWNKKKQQREWDDCLVNWFIIIQVSEQCSSGPISQGARWQTWTTMWFLYGNLKERAIMPIYAVGRR